jgi:hypothetical protein
MDSIIFYQPQLVTAPNLNKPVRSLATIPRNDIRSALLQNSEWNASWRDPNMIECPGATNLYRRGQPQIGQQACSDSLLRDQGAC